MLPEHEVSESMFRLILLTGRQIEHRGSWSLPLCYFAFWTVRLAGWLPRFNICSTCGKAFGKQNAYQADWFPGLACEEHRRSGMKPVSPQARELAERFTRTSLDKLDLGPEFELPSGNCVRQDSAGSSITRKKNCVHATMLEMHLKSKVKLESNLSTQA